VEPAFAAPDAKRKAIASACQRFGGRAGEVRVYADEASPKCRLTDLDLARMLDLGASSLLSDLKLSSHDHHVKGNLQVKNPVQLISPIAPVRSPLARSPLWRDLLLIPLAATIAWFTLSPTTWAQTASPNIVVILADDLGYGDVGFNGCADIPTPNIDSVAANGALCTNGYATHCYCSPSRAAIITGRYQHRFGYDTAGRSDMSPRPRAVCRHIR
jgi:Sulfatase